MEKIERPMIKIEIKRYNETDKEARMGEQE